MRRFLLSMAAGVLAIGGLVFLATPASAHPEHGHNRHEIVHRKFHRDAGRHEIHYRHAAHVHGARRGWHRR